MFEFIGAFMFEFMGAFMFESDFMLLFIELPPVGVMLDIPAGVGEFIGAAEFPFELLVMYPVFVFVPRRFALLLAVDSQAVRPAAVISRLNATIFFIFLSSFFFICK